MFPLQLAIRGDSGRRLLLTEHGHPAFNSNGFSAGHCLWFDWLCVMPGARLEGCVKRLQADDGAGGRLIACT
jgi:hypothetical protein